MQTATIRTVANSLPKNEVILLTFLNSERFIPYTDFMGKFIGLKQREDSKRFYAPFF